MNSLKLPGQKTVENELNTEIFGWLPENFCIQFALHNSPTGKLQKTHGIFDVINTQKKSFSL